MEEAHRYLSGKSDSTASDVVQRIAKEGRKYGVGAMVVSQRPSEVDETILSQCGTFFALRLSNPADRARVQGTLPDGLVGLLDILPILRTGEAIVTGEAAKLPMRCRVTFPEKRHRPRSEDPEVSKSWRLQRRAEGYDRVVASWRAQSPFAITKDLRIRRASVEDTRLDTRDTILDKQPVSSSTIESIGYDAHAQTLEIEFESGRVYQYYGVPDHMHSQIMQAPSKGSFLNSYIKNRFPYSRIA